MTQRVRPSTVVVLSIVALLSLACRGEPRQTNETRQIGHLVDSLLPSVQRSTGLRFKTKPRYAIRSRDQVGAFVRRKLAEQMPPDRFALYLQTYQLLGMLPDTLDLPALMERLLTQQIAGYYDPDSSTLYAVAGANPEMQRLTIAHELVHALQDQYLPLDSILNDRRDNDRMVAAQAILEGQAHFASLLMLQDSAVVLSDEFWARMRELGDQVLGVSGLDSVPLIIREGLLFPYFSGGMFMRWWATSSLRDTVPYGPRMPQSTEQILFPARYAAGDVPRNVQFTDTMAGSFEDDLGEFELHLLSELATGRRAIDIVLAFGWGGDRFRVTPTPEGPALVWYVVWDAPAGRDRFVRQTSAFLTRERRPGYAAAVDTLTIDGLAAMRTVIAPKTWIATAKLPEARVLP